MQDPTTPAYAGVSLMALAIGLVGPQFGPYVVILLGSIGGGLWAISVTPLTGKLAALWLMVRCVFTAIILTAVIAELLGRYWGVQVDGSYALVSFVIGMLGNGWKSIIAAARLRIVRAIDTAEPKA